MAAKCYKVIKDHPLWEVGTIIVEKDGNYYVADGFESHIKDIKGLSEKWHEGGTLVENQPEWFQRVYPVNLLTKTVYKARDEAKELMAKNYTE